MSLNRVIVAKGGSVTPGVIELSPDRQDELLVAGLGLSQAGCGKG